MGWKLWIWRLVVDSGWFHAPPTPPRQTRNQIGRGDTVDGRKLIIGSLSHYLQDFSTVPGGCLGFPNHQPSTVFHHNFRLGESRSLGFWRLIVDPKQHPEVLNDLSWCSLIDSNSREVRRHSDLLEAFFTMLSREGDLAQIRFDWNGCTHHFEEKKWHISISWTTKKWTLKIMVWKRNFLATMGIFGVHVSFRECTPFESISHPFGFSTSFRVGCLTNDSKDWYAFLLWLLLPEAPSFNTLLPVYFRNCWPLSYPLNRGSRLMRIKQNGPKALVFFLKPINKIHGLLNRNPLL